MQKQRWAACRTERSGDLLRDDAALAHAGHHHASVAFAAAHYQFYRAIEIRSHLALKPYRERLKRRSLRAHQFGGSKAVLFVVAIHRFLMVTLQGTGNREQGTGNREQGLGTRD